LPPGVSCRGIAESFSTATPLSLYGSAKLASEILATEYGEAFGFPVWINRCGVLAGAGQFGRIDQGIFAFWINAWLRRHPVKYVGFGGNGHQVRDCLHPRDLAALLAMQMAARQRQAPHTVNVGGGLERAMSLAQLSGWCRNRLGDHPVGVETRLRPFDIPWFVMDSSLAATRWGWRPTISLEAILEEIADHARQHPDWLELSA
jgi:CDP-paratose 2-epimerase